MQRHLINPVPGVSPALGFYLSGMEEVRNQVRQAVAGIDVEWLGRPAFPGAHSIGGLVLHIGEAEWWWMQCIVSDHKLTEQDREQAYWDVLKDPEGFARRGYTAEFCLGEIQKIRNQTREVLAAFNDDDLERISGFERDGSTHEHSLRWILHHLIDHEAQHKGQILMLKRLMGLKN
jgi:uncharacterized damage-inducible protein DinB